MNVFQLANALNKKQVFYKSNAVSSPPQTFGTQASNTEGK
jgi:hypothetical protein